MTKQLGPLDWRIAITDGNGRPTPEFQRRWAIQNQNNLLVGVTLGNGPPPITPVPVDGQEYVNTATTPWTLYVSQNGTWTIVGVYKFTQLSDVPHNYSGAANKLVAVNAGATGLTFIAPPVIPPLLSYNGPPGSDGIDGEDGWSIPGPPGKAGVAGVSGLSGYPIPGMDGMDGDDGWTIPGLTISNPWTIGSAKVYSGSGAPAPNSPPEGSLYMRTDTGVAYNYFGAGTLVPIVVILTSGTSWTVPSNWASGSNTIECIGGGSNGAGFAGIGGTGGTYSKITNLALTAGGTVTYSVGASGGGDTWFNGTSASVASVTAPGGGSATTAIGSAINSGGAGVNGSSGGGGGGGAGGPHGVGASGGFISGSPNGGGGGGGGGGTAGSSGTGGNNYLGAGGGSAGGAAGTNGGGGGGGLSFSSAGGAGGAGAEWVTAGSGGGGGGGGEDETGGAGGNYGGGGGAGGNITGAFGSGAAGVIVITYLISAAGALQNWEPLSNLTTIKSRGVTTTSGAQSLNFTSGMTVSDDGFGNETVSLSVPFQGIPGMDGADGDDGWSILGPAGPVGATGATRVSGYPIPGMDGTDGDDGWPIPGPPGPVGATGPSGGFTGTYHTVTGSRSVGTTYTNSTGNVMFIAVTFYQSGGAGVTLEMEINGVAVNAETTTVAGGYNKTLYGFANPGDTYAVIQFGAGTIVQNGWVERY